MPRFCSIHLWHQLIGAFAQVHACVQQNLGNFRPCAALPPTHKALGLPPPRRRRPSEPLPGLPIRPVVNPWSKTLNRRMYESCSAPTTFAGRVCIVDQKNARRQHHKSFASDRRPRTLSPTTSLQTACTQRKFIAGAASRQWIEITGKAERLRGLLRLGVERRCNGAARERNPAVLKSVDFEVTGRRGTASAEQGEVARRARDFQESMRCTERCPRGCALLSVRLTASGYFGNFIRPFARDLSLPSFQMA